VQLDSALRQLPNKLSGQTELRSPVPPSHRLNIIGVEPPCGSYCSRACCHVLRFQRWGFSGSGGRLRESCLGTSARMLHCCRAHGQEAGLQDLPRLVGAAAGPIPGGVLALRCCCLSNLVILVARRKLLLAVHSPPGSATCLTLLENPCAAVSSCRALRLIVAGPCCCVAVGALSGG
jgi:hypothetical protein